MDRTLTDPKDILDFVSVQSAIDFTATTDSEIGELQERAVTVASMTLQLEDQNTTVLTDEAFGIIASSVVGGMNAKEAALAGYQTLVSYFGPSGVPDQLPTTWAKAWKGWKEDKKDKGPLIPEITEERGVELEQVQNTAAVVDQAVMDAEEIFRDLGRLEGISFVATVADVAAAQIFEKIKKNKAYKNIPYVDADGNRQQITDLEEFCRVKLDKSYSRIKQLSQNLRTLGPDLYESAERIGFRAKDYRALKALPAEEQEVVKAALASESKDEVVDILQDMAARHQAEKEAVKKEKEDMTADLEARGKLLEDKGTRLDEVSLELQKLKSLPLNQTMELKLKREHAVAEALGLAHITYLVETNTFFQTIADVLSADEVSAHTKEYATQTVRKCCEGMSDFLIKHGIGVDFQNMVQPEWMQETAEEDIARDFTDEPSGAHKSW